MGYKDYQIGDVVTATITGIQQYGIFAALDKETQGLIHVSEVKHGFVDNVDELFEVGENIEVMILDIDEFDGRMSLSLRSLQKTKQHPFSNRKKNPRYGKKTGTGFESLANRLPKWIDTSMSRINNS